MDEDNNGQNSPYYTYVDMSCMSKLLTLIKFLGTNIWNDYTVTHISNIDFVHN
jgi:hypothetical protein